MIRARVRDAARAQFRRAVGMSPRLYAWRIRTQRFSRGSVHDPDFEVLRGASLRLAVDVGANRGQSIVSIKSIAPSVEIFAFESNGQLLAPLLKLAKRYDGVNVAAVGCGAHTSLDKLYIPTARGIVFEQYASLNPPDPTAVLDLVRDSGFTWCKPDDISILVGTCVFAPIDQLLLHLETPVDLLKVDVEGAELEVIRGALGVVDRDHPLILAERPNAELIQMLTSRGYEHHRSRCGENSLFVDPQRARALDRRLLDELFELSSG